MTRPSKLLTIFTALVTAVFSLTAAVALPILWRGWYYGQVVSLRLVEQTGYSAGVIRGAFDAVMDYLVKDAPFSTGALLSSESGAAHFADCKVLFRLDFVALAVSGAILLLLLLIALFSTGFDWRAGVWQVIEIAIGMAVWLPFMHISERATAKQMEMQDAA